MPTQGELRAAGANAHIARIDAELHTALARSRRGRLISRIIRWRARRDDLRKRGRPARNKR